MTNIALCTDQKPATDQTEQNTATDWQIIIVMDNLCWDTGIDQFSNLKDQENHFDAGMVQRKVFEGIKAAAEEQHWVCFKARMPSE